MTHARAVVRDELFADLAAVTARIVAAIRSEIPAYDALEPTQLGEVREIAAWGVGRVLEAWVADSTLTADDLARFRGIGAARALDGRPLPGVLRAYRIAGVQVTDLVAERAHGRLSVEDAIALARLWMASIDALSEALYGGHREASERLAEQPTRALTDLLDDLLTGRNATTVAVAARTRTLGALLPTTLTLLVAHSPRGAEDLDAWRSAVEESRVGPGSVLHGVRDGLLLAVTGSVDTPRLTALATQRSWRTVVQRGRAEEVARLHRASTAAFAVTPPWAWTQNHVLDEVDVAVLLRATSGRDVDTTVLHHRIIEPLSSGPDLLETLRAHLGSGSASAAAITLGCHVQTVRYRLRRIHELTGRDIQQTWDRYVLESASLMCHSE